MNNLHDRLILRKLIYRGNWFIEETDFLNTAGARKCLKLVKLQSFVAKYFMENIAVRSFQILCIFVLRVEKVS